MTVVVRPLTLHPDAAREAIAWAVLGHMFDYMPDSAVCECECGIEGSALTLALHVADEAIRAATA